MLTTYGKNRFWLEKKITENFPNHLIVRLPALYGKNLKKNFIYDYMNIIPSMLKEEKFQELLSQNIKLIDFYQLQENGLYKCRELSDMERCELKSFFMTCGFNAKNFTDSRACYQFYNLSYLWTHIQKALQNRIHKLNITSEPVQISELYQYLEGKSFHNEIAKIPVNQDLHSKNAAIFGGANGYFFDKSFVFKDIKQFIKKEI